MAPNISTSTTIKIIGLTADSVSLEFTTQTIIGNKTYTDDPVWYNRSNSEVEREDVRETLEIDYPNYYAAIMAVWGDEPTVEVPVETPEEIPEGIPVEVPVENVTGYVEDIETVDTTYYNSMPVVELKAIAKERGLSGYSSMTKAELITLLESNDNKDAEV